MAIILEPVNGVLLADDWPQWNGPRRDAVWRETGLVDRFPAAGLKVMWRTPIAAGYSGPAVAGGKVFVSDYVRTAGRATNNPGARDRLQGKERILCLSAADGKILWKHEYDCPYHISYPAGPRATPTVNEGNVYCLGAEGNLICLDAETGKVIWSKELKKDYDTQTPMWGFCGHPLVDGDRLICLVGGAGSVAVAFDKKTGKEIWRAITASDPGYSPPTLIEAGGATQLLIWDADKINSLDPQTGKRYWSVPLKPSYTMSIMAPQKYGDYLFASGIGRVSALLKLDRNRPGAKVQRRGAAKTDVFAANSTPFIDKGVVYGADCHGGSLIAADLTTGERLWETHQPTTGDPKVRSHGTAFLVKNRNRFFIFSETGDLILAQLSRDGYKEISRFHVLEPTHEVFGRTAVWSYPAFANRCVYARNDKEIVCVSLAK